jgi:2-polyprenyl-3-methyl-5-hydroxy-6-metoxy-1,4-benzoquinol methylase
LTTSASARPEHWDAAYGRREETTLSWFQDEPKLSLRLVDDALADARTDDGPTGRIQQVIDVGAGTSRLADALVVDGRSHVTVLDVSERALAALAARLAARGHSDRVTRIVADVTTWRPTGRFDVWHDRAVLHFLTDPQERDAYVRTAAEAVVPGGRLIVATFAQDGPESCSALPVQRYTPEELAAVFDEHFEPVTSLREEHVTPDGRVQPFTWVVLSRRRP